MSVNNDVRAGAAFVAKYWVKQYPSAGHSFTHDERHLQDIN